MVISMQQNSRNCRYRQAVASWHCCRVESLMLFATATILLVNIVGCDKQATGFGTSRLSGASIATDEGRAQCWVSWLVNERDETYRLPMVLYIEPATGPPAPADLYSFHAGPSGNYVAIKGIPVEAAEGCVLLVDLEDCRYRVLDDVEWQIADARGDRDGLRELMRVTLERERRMSEEKGRVKDVTGTTYKEVSEDSQ
jgi:hypothetical protein